MTRKILVVCLFIALFPGLVTLAGADRDEAEMIYGAVLIRSMDKVLVLAVDSEDASLSRDGLVDQIFVYYLSEPLPEPLSFRTDRAMLIFGKGRVQLTSPDGPTTLRFAVRTNGSPRIRPRADLKVDDPCIELNESGLATGGAPRSLALDSGIGLARYPKINGTPFGYFETADLTQLNYRSLTSVPSDFDAQAKCAAPQCAAGGAGSSGCSISSCCSVDCQSGYYACCHCTNGCNCVKQ